MSADLELNPGDRVRVQVDCVMTVHGPLGFLYADRDQTRDFSFDVDCLAVLDAKIERVDVFKPGDVLRRRTTGELYLLGEVAYVSLSDAVTWKYGSTLENGFPSSDFERVTAP